LDIFLVISTQFWKINVATFVLDFDRVVIVLFMLVFFLFLVLIISFLALADTFFIQPTVMLQEKENEYK
jgi:hypothetical protein